jgi:hypothetical protein
MPLIGTHDLAAQAMDAAEAAVKATWLAKARVLTPAEIDQMRTEIRAAGISALFAHFSANAQINGVAAVGLVAPPGGGPVTGAVVLPPGSIT